MTDKMVVVRVSANTSVRDYEASVKNILRLRGSVEITGLSQAIAHVTDIVSIITRTCPHAKIESPALYWGIEVKGDTKQALDNLWTNPKYEVANDRIPVQHIPEIFLAILDIMNLPKHMHEPMGMTINAIIQYALDKAKFTKLLRQRDFIDLCEYIFAGPYFFISKRLMEQKIVDKPTEEELAFVWKNYDLEFTKNIERIEIKSIFRDMLLRKFGDKFGDFSVYDSTFDGYTHFGFKSGNRRRIQFDEFVKIVSILFH